MPDISHFQRWSIYWYQDLCARYLSLPALVYILVSGSLCQISFTSSVGRILISGSLCQISLTSSVGLYIGIRIFVTDISHFQRWSIYWYQDICARYLSLPALVYILVSGYLCQISFTSSVGLYIDIRIFVPDISHFLCWSIYWYQDLCARYNLSLPALVYILVSGSLCQISLTSSVGLYIGIRIFVPDMSHFQRWSYNGLCRFCSLLMAR